MFDFLRGDPERDPRAVVHLRWLSADEGGRATPPPGPRYAAAARFATFGLASHDFSVVLDLGPGGQLATLRLLAPEDEPDAAARIREGARLRICEGPRIVAEAEVQYVAGLGSDAPS